MTIVLGLGVSGKGAAEFLLKQGREVIGFDDRLEDLKEGGKSLSLSGLTLCSDPQEINWDLIQEVVVSPGVSPLHVIYQEGIKRGIKVIGEVELALPYLHRPLIGVTGTNGKTTVVLLVEHVLNASGIKARAIGNVGTSLCHYLNQTQKVLNGVEEQVLVVEVSSYQLETMNTPCFEIGALLNLSPDHLDRYQGMKEYAEAKFQIQRCIRQGGQFLIGKKVAADWKELIDFPRYQVFGWGDREGLWTDGKKIYDQEVVESLLPEQWEEMGRHDLENVVAAWGLVRPFKVKGEVFCDALARFQKPHHRIEFVKNIEGVLFYDDSKGTNVDAVIQAVDAMKGPVILIAGGVDKGASYLPWKRCLSGKVKKMIVLGQAAQKIIQELGKDFSIIHVETLASSVEMGYALASEGDCVLLSPGCSSYDMFCDYTHRGKEFQRCVHLLEKSPFLRRRA